MKKLFISLILLLLHFALCFSMAPNWLVNPEKEFPSGRDCVRGIKVKRRIDNPPPT